MHATHIGRYEVVRVLGKGAMGVVCEARDPRLARAVAIKTIRSDKLTPVQVAAYEARFLTEARSVARLSHPNIVSVFDSGHADDVTFLVMEFVPGINLKHCLNHGVRFTPWGAVKVVLDVLAALDHAHRQKILHRDVKPENILLDATGWVKLTDFGIAKIMDAEEDNGTQLSGLSIGTPRYMSPEQVRGQPLDERSDLFSAGVLLYELLTARLPFDGSNQFAIAAQILNEVPPLPSVINPAVPAELDAVVARAMAKHPAERFQTGEAFAEALLATGHLLAGGDLMTRAVTAQALVAAESAGMLRWLLSRMLTGAALSPELPDVPDVPDTPAEGTRFFQREAASSPALAAALPPARSDDLPAQMPISSTGTAGAAGTTAGTTSAAGTTAGEALGTAVDATASVTSDQAAPASAVEPQLMPEAAAVTVVAPHAALDETVVTAVETVTEVVTEVVRPASTATPHGTAAPVAAQVPAGPTGTPGGGAGRWVGVGLAVLLLGGLAWWFAPGRQPPPAMPAAVTDAATDAVDPRQTLSADESLVQPGGATTANSAAAAAPSMSQPESPASAASSATSGAAPPTVSSDTKKTVKPADGAAANKPTDARNTGKPIDAGAVTAPPPPIAADKPATATPSVPAPQPVAAAEPCTGLGFFERESCLWKQCATDAFRAHAACERFQSRKPAD